MTNKISYPILALEVEKLYSKQFSNEGEIDQHIKYISNYIKACGWSEEEYLNRWLREQDKEDGNEQN